MHTKLDKPRGMWQVKIFFLLFTNTDSDRDIVAVEFQNNKKSLNITNWASNATVKLASVHSFMQVIVGLPILDNSSVLDDAAFEVHFGTVATTKFKDPLAALAGMHGGNVRQNVGELFGAINAIDFLRKYLKRKSTLAVHGRIW